MDKAIKTHLFKSILVIDDDEQHLFVAEQVLNAGGGAETIHLHTSAAEALALLIDLSNNGKEFPEFIMVDVRMPIMDAFSFLEKAEKLPGFKESGCCVALITAFFDYDEGPEIRERAKKHACIVHLFEKPFDLEKLAELN